MKKALMRMKDVQGKKPVMDLLEKYGAKKLTEIPEEKWINILKEFKEGAK